MTGLTDARVELKAEIPLLLVGYDFRRASSELREKLLTGKEERKYIFKSLGKYDRSAGILFLETCNRIEWIVSTQFSDWISEIFTAWMIRKWQPFFPETASNSPLLPYVYTGQNAVNHILKVVVGMESLATGEAQIATQFQFAIKEAQREKTSSVIINKLSHIAGRISKTGARIGFRSNHKQGIHGLVVRFIENYFQRDLNKKTILVAGMGEIGRRTSTLLREMLQCKVQSLNRTINPEHLKEWRPLNQLKPLSIKADALIVATGSPVPVIDIGNIAIDDRQAKLLIMDIGIPRQVTQSAQNNPKIEYRNLDHLLDFNGGKEKNPCVDQLEMEINKEVSRFKQFCRGRELNMILSRIHNGRLKLTENLIPDFVASQFSDLEKRRRKKLENTIKQFVKDYSNELFLAFHQTMKEFWRNNGQ